MDPILFLGAVVALAGLAGAAWSLFLHVREGRAAAGGEPPKVARSRGAVIGSVLVFSVILGLGIAIVFVALRGAASAGTDGVWSARFEIDGSVYEGQIEVQGNAGPLTVSWPAAQGRNRVVQQCRLRREGQRVTIGCRDPKMIAGQGSYSPDNFDLTFANADTLQGSVTSRNGAAAGSAMFVRR